MAALTLVFSQNDMLKPEAACSNPRSISEYMLLSPFETKTPPLPLALTRLVYAPLEADLVEAHVGGEVELSGVLRLSPFGLESV
jgi:hypothetical protein